MIEIDGLFFPDINIYIAIEAARMQYDFEYSDNPAIFAENARKAEKAGRQMLIDAGYPKDENGRVTLLLKGDIGIYDL